ncbi:MAG: ImmA/IrrE family metallo-endopeptidase [Lachnospiraceae bacterium]|nr:ImmA/IrrE family metallo-endopeptidase [Lachnospiraceae bacterium]
MINKPDYDRAAAAAMQLLVENHFAETPVNPLPLMLNYPGVRVLPYTKMATDAGIDRKDLVPVFGNQDAATFHLDMPGMDDVRYVVVYNMRLPFEIIWRAIARELGHIVLGHDGVTRSMEARMAEAVCFAHHLISPRPVLHLLRQSGPLTMNVLANTTGCSEECVDEMQTIPGAHVPADLNRQVRDLFAPHLNEYLNFYHSSAKKDKSPLVDLGTFMDGYEE